MTQRKSVVEVNYKTALEMQKHLRESFSLLLGCGFPKEVRRVKVKRNADGSFKVTLPTGVVKALINLPKEKARHLCGLMQLKWKQQNNRRCIKLEKEWVDIAHITHVTTILMSIYSPDCKALLRLKELFVGKPESLRKLCKG